MKDKKHVPEMIILGVLVAGCSFFVVTRLIGHKAGPPSPPAAKASRSPQASQKLPMGQGQQTGPVAAAPGSTAPGVQVASAAPGRRDPFAPAMDVSIKAPAIRVGPRVPTLMASRDFGAKLPVVPFPIGTGASATIVSPQGPGPGPQPGSASPPAQPSTPDFVLTGVITGRTNVAIIRLGEGRFIVKEGQLVNGAYKVVSVSEDGVRLSRDGRSFFLKLGGERNAS